MQCRADDTVPDLPPPAAADDIADRSDWRNFVSGAVGTDRRQGSGAGAFGQASLDVAYQHRFAPSWQFNFADRLDATAVESGHDDHVNTLKEVYVGWQPNAEWTADLGRINARIGEAIAFNPTDIFKEGALRSITSVVPQNLRENRQGSVMARGQRLWEGAAVTAIFSPRISSGSDAAFSADARATNARTRWVLMASKRLTPEFSPQVIVSQAEGEHALVGANLSTLINQSAVGYLEWSGGQRASALSQATGRPDDTRWRNQVAVGTHFTVLQSLTLNFEYDYDGTGNDAAQRELLASLPPAFTSAYRAFVLKEQTLPNRHNAYVAATWKGAWSKNLDLSAFTRRDLDDRSSQAFAEIRYRFDNLDVAVQWLDQHGTAQTTFAQRNLFELLLVRYF